MTRPPRNPVFIRRHPESLARTRLPKIADAHDIRSRAAILHVAEKAIPGSVLVLGAGSCQEIPLKQLVQRFAEVRLIDEDAAALATAADIASLDAAERQRLMCSVSDLTGLSDPLSESIKLALPQIAPQAEQDPAEWVDRLALLVERLELPAQPPLPPADFVVVSCVISQLHLTALHRAIEAIETHVSPRVGGDGVAQWQQAPRWTAALMNLARRLESRFIENLAGVLATGGVAYVSDSVQMCFVQGMSDGGWSSEGLYRMTRTPSLSGYFDARFATVPLGEWAWIVDPPERPADVGRAYRVQALQVKLAT